MEINLTVTHTASPELLDALRGLVGGGAAPKQTRKSRTAEPASEPVGDEQPVHEGADPIVIPATNGHSAEPKNGTDVSNKANGTLTVEQVRAVVQTKNEAGKRDSVRALLTKFGTPSITKMDPAKYAEFFQEVSAL